MPPPLIDFADHLAGQPLADRTVKEYVKYARRLISWAPMDPVLLDRAMIRTWAATVPPSWSSRKQARTAIGHWMRWRGRDDDCWDAIPVPPKPDMECRAIEVDDAEALRDTAIMHGGREGCAALIVLYTGARRIEVARMQWSFFDLEAATVKWPRAKRGRSRTVDLHPVLLDALQGLPRHSDYLFPGDRGRPHVTPTTVWAWCRRIGGVAGVYFPPHVGRHTALAHALDATKDYRAVMDLAGHRDPTVTAGYTRTTRARMGQVIRSLPY